MPAMSIYGMDTGPIAEENLIYVSRWPLVMWHSSSSYHCQQWTWNQSFLIFQTDLSDCFCRKLLGHSRLETWNKLSFDSLPTFPKILILLLLWLEHCSHHVLFCTCSELRTAPPIFCAFSCDVAPRSYLPLPKTREKYTQSDVNVSIRIFIEG